MFFTKMYKCLSNPYIYVIKRNFKKFGFCKNMVFSILIFSCLYIYV
jgi:hypothetical protein